ncbi:MAG: adenylate/guanylate cyclase domain-containing protein [Fluviicoccus sp.]|uniref:adenylate/guanylate cyclase domain-containing protein n=1 Tax=Fluviicoccus sp. TaxID=2003552 RepID=UPI002728E86B|nr:adenylate/guanylate cyclase domain-containing protein [Fluviicoccus sp.]MDO8331392.1 adenylate/guanylate cyclase domain-containing protein [Fluviicoccus sp.]
MKKPDDDCAFDPRNYLRRPDRGFWLDLLTPMPTATDHDLHRRERLARYSLGASLVISAFYVLLTLITLAREGQVLTYLNLGAMACYGMGMWAASLGAHAQARLWLMVTLEAHVGVLVWITGNALGVGMYALVAAVLARTLYSQKETLPRFTFISGAMLILLGSMAVSGQAVLPLENVPDWMLSTMRMINAVMALEAIVIILAVFQKEVLRSEQNLIVERERSDRLLHAVLPRKIALELRDRDRMIADHHPEVTVLFADIAGFTPWASQHDPEVVVGLLEKIFTRFDARVNAAGAEKIKTIGDAYMVISGAPDPRHDHAHVMAQLALDLVEEVKAIRHETGIALDLRLGMHTGPVIAGVIGAMRFTYDVWGDTVNTASRMESHGEPGRVQISAESRERVQDQFYCELRGSIYVKGKGEMETWWLVGKHS